MSLLQWALHTKLLHLKAVARTSRPRVRVGLAAAHLRVLCFDLPLRGLLLSLLLLLLRLLALLVCFSLLVLTFLVLPFLLVRVLFAGADVLIHSVRVLGHRAVRAFGHMVAMLVPYDYRLN